jgi:hypothetical protein
MITQADVQNSVSGSRLFTSLIPSLKNTLYGQMKIKRRVSEHKREWWTPKTCDRRKALMFWTWQSGEAFRQVWLGLFFNRSLYNCKVTWNFAKHSDVGYLIVLWRCKCGLAAGWSSVPFWAQCSRYIDQKFPMWMGHRESANWSPTSPDLTPCDFAMCGTVRGKVYCKELPYFANEVNKSKWNFTM